MSIVMKYPLKRKRNNTIPKIIDFFFLLSAGEIVWINFPLKSAIAEPALSVSNKSGLHSKAANLSNKASVILAALAQILR